MNHPIIQNVDCKWPLLLGYQETILKENAVCIAQTSYGHPFIAVNECGKGRTMIWSSDIGPHWCPKEFAEWPGYSTIWQQAIRWLAKH